MSHLTPTPEDKFSFGLWTVQYPGRDPFGEALAFRADPEVRSALEEAELPELAVPTRAEGETWGDLEAAHALDVEALGARGLAFERLDQLAMEHLYGVRS
jgi:xylose isomerase